MCVDVHTYIDVWLVDGRVVMLMMMLMMLVCCVQPVCPNARLLRLLRTHLHLFHDARTQRFRLSGERRLTSLRGRAERFCDGERVCLSVCLSVCPRAYLRKHMLILRQIV